MVTGRQAGSIMMAPSMASSSSIAWGGILPSIRPAVVLFEEMGNIVVAGITSNLRMKGISLTEKEGAIKNSVIKTNYVFTIADELVEKKLFELTKQKKLILYKELEGKISELKQ